MYNQLLDHGAVIGYSPRLEYNKDISSLYNTDNEENQVVNTEDIKYSSSLQHFINNTPSFTINALNQTSELLRDLIDLLSDSFEKNNWKMYGDISSLLNAINNDNDKYIKDFVNYHKYDITKSIIPELISYINDANKRIKLVSSTLTKLFYGEGNFQYEDINKIDTSYINRLTQYERDHLYHKINYATIVNDTLLNRTTTQYAYATGEACIHLTEILNDDNNIKSDRTKTQFINKIFQEVNSEIDLRDKSYEKYQTIEILEKTLYNYYNKRKDLINMYDLLSGNESIYLGRKISEYQNALEYSIKEVNKTYIGSKIYISELKELEQQKYYLSNIYRQLNVIL